MYIYVHIILGCTAKYRLVDFLEYGIYATYF